MMQNMFRSGPLKWHCLTSYCSADKLCQQPFDVDDEVRTHWNITITEITLASTLFIFPLKTSSLALNMLNHFYNELIRKISHND